MSVHAQGLALKAGRQMIKNFEETGLYESNIERKNREEKQLERTKRLGSIKKHYVSLLGDSIIDNKVYVGEGELSVTEHLQNNSSSNYPFCPITLGVSFLDQINVLENLKKIEFKNVAYPIIFISFISRSSEIIGKKINVKIDEKKMLLNLNVNIISNFY